MRILCNKFMKTMNYRKIGNYYTQVVPDKVNEDYEDAIRKLNGLQSNSEYIKIAQKMKLSHTEEYSKTIAQTQKYLLRSGISLETLDTLPVIHVTGTKGKGSTCALCESILRHHGLRTGFYSSPHLLEVRERIRLNGSSISQQMFAEHFWQVYNKLDKQKDNPSDMPIYFKFLTILAFHIFLTEKVDVAIIEVGIGGEYDCTNVLRNVPIAGITSLGLDHTSILGDSVEKIAWHKGGIMKSDGRVFTVPQADGAMRVLKQRSTERQCQLSVVEVSSDVSTMNGNRCPSNIFNLNSSLATALAQSWLNYQGKKLDLKLTKKGLLNCKWPGRYQVLQQPPNTYYLDGAHTPESMQVCAQWFANETRRSSNKKVLIFNVTGDRNSEDLMSKLMSCSFDKVFFVPNKAASIDVADMKNFNAVEHQQLVRCHNHYNIWMNIEGNCSASKAEVVQVMPTIIDALNNCTAENHDVLITGSLHLVGAALSVIDLNLSSYKNK